MQPGQPDGSLHTPAEAATLLGVSGSGLRRLGVIYVRAGGDLPRDARSNSRLWPHEAVAELAAARRLVANGSTDSVEESLLQVWRALADGKVTRTELALALEPVPDREAGKSRTAASAGFGRGEQQGRRGLGEESHGLRALLLDMAGLLVDVREELVRLRASVSWAAGSGALGSGGFATRSGSVTPIAGRDSSAAAAAQGEDELSRLRLEVEALRRELLVHVREQRDVRNEDARHQDARRQVLRHRDLRHQDARHHELRHQDLRHRDARHQDLRHQVTWHHDDGPVPALGERSRSPVESAGPMGPVAGRDAIHQSLRSEPLAADERSELLALRRRLRYLEAELDQREI